MNENMERAITLESVAKVYEWIEKAVYDSHEDPKPYHVSNECNMLNNIVLGMTAKQYRALNNIVDTTNGIRPYLSLDDLKAIDYLQTIDLGLIKVGVEYKQRKAMLTNEYSVYKQAQQPRTLILFI